MQGGSLEPRSRRQGVGAEATRLDSLTAPGLRKSLPVGTRKSAATVARITGALQSNIIFSRLNEQQLTLLHRAMVEHQVPAGANVITQGEKGNHFYVVGSGELDAFVAASPTAAQPEPPRPQFVKTFSAGDMFGELALMYNCPRTASIQARTHATRPPQPRPLSPTPTPNPSPCPESQP